MEKHGSDIGHGWHSRRYGYYDPGATSPAGRGGKADKLVTIEHNVNAQNDRLYRAHLKASGAAPIVISGPLGGRADLAKSFGVKSLISWHVNANPDPRADGFALYIHPERSDSRALAKSIESRLIRSKVLEKYGADYNGIKTDPSLYITRVPKMPVVLVEDLFLSNIDDEILLHDAGFGAELTGVICDGVLDHFGGRKDNRLYYVTWPSSRANQNKVMLDILGALKALRLPLYEIHPLADGRLQVIATAKSRDELLRASEKARWKAHVIEKK